MSGWYYFINLKIVLLLAAPRARADPGLGPRLRAKPPMDAALAPGGGVLVMMLMVPPVAPPPYSTDPEPRRISMRSMLSSGIAVQPIVVSSISLRRWPFSSTRVF